MIKNLVVFVVVVAAYSCFAETRIIYGEDNRVDLKNVHDQRIHDLGTAIAGRVYNFSFTENSDKSAVAFERILSLSHPRSMNVCKEEKFSNQPTVADCTGFLVSPTLLVTAGHCLTDPGTTVEDTITPDCESFSWMFDYNISKKNKMDLSNFDINNIYSCKNVVIAKFTDVDDFAVIELSRAVTGRKPLKLNLNKAPAVGTKLFVMGHPSGLPLKYADGAKVFENKETYFSTNLDTFQGNSGSPVFNFETLEVEGILVRGDVDYVSTTTEDGGRCSKVNTCDEERENCKEDDPGIKGEHVSLISRILNKI